MLDFLLKLIYKFSMDKKSIREIAISSGMYSLGLILAPLLLFGSVGWVLDKLVFNTYPIILSISIFIAFIVTNFLLFKKIKKINALIDKFKKEAIKEKNSN